MEFNQFRRKTSCVTWRHNSTSQVFAAKIGMLAIYVKTMAKWPKVIGIMWSVFDRTLSLHRNSFRTTTYYICLICWSVSKVLMLVVNLLPNRRLVCLMVSYYDVIFILAIWLWGHIIKVQCQITCWGFNLRSITPLKPLKHQGSGIKDKKFSFLQQSSHSHILLCLYTVETR